MSQLGDSRLLIKPHLVSTFIQQPKYSEAQFYWLLGISCMVVIWLHIYLIKRSFFRPAILWLLLWTTSLLKVWHMDFPVNALILKEPCWLILDAYALKCLISNCKVTRMSDLFKKYILLTLSKIQLSSLPECAFHRQSRTVNGGSKNTIEKTRFNQINTLKKTHSVV